MEVTKIEVTNCPFCGATHTHSFDMDQDFQFIVLRRVKLDSVTGSETVLPREFVQAFICPNTEQVFRALITITEGEEPEVKVLPLSLSDQVSFELAKKELADSMNVGREFARFMTTLNAALIPAYLALLKFVGMDEATIKIILNLKWVSIVPPALFLGSCAIFIVACFPRGGEYSLEALSEIVSTRNKLIQRRRKLIFSASALFLSGILALIVIISIGLNT